MFEPTPSRFTGLSGSYFSLQYLSVSDATVLQFLAPMCTGIVGALVLKEHFSRSQAFASRESVPSAVLTTCAKLRQYLACLGLCLLHDRHSCSDVRRATLTQP